MLRINGRDLTSWPAYDARSDVALELGDSVAPIPVPHKAALDFFDTYFERLRRSTTQSKTPVDNSSFKYFDLILPYW